MPCPTDPQYRVQRRPIRSIVKTQMSVANVYVMLFSPETHWDLSELKPAMLKMAMEVVQAGQ